MTNEMKFAVLIDADNISHSYIKIILDEISNEGIATYKRIYGDWTKPSLNSWKPILLEYSILPIQQYGYTTGKNSTDSAMIIDAMDILYTKQVDGFCLVASDSDYTRLAARLREAGATVIGMGETKTPKPFIVACNQFKYLDKLLRNSEPKAIPRPVHAVVAPVVPVLGTDKPEIQTDIETLCKAMKTIVEENADDEGWILMAVVGGIMAKRFPDFDVRNFGFPRLTPFINSLGLFEMKTEMASDGKIKHNYIRLKDN